MELKENRKNIFISGAPRSGTTLLSQLMDSHPNLATYPFEDFVFEKYFLEKNDFNYFKTSFINNVKEGQQAIMSSKENLDAYTQKLILEYKKKNEIEVDCLKYLTTYKNEIRKEFTLENIFRALSKAVIASNEYLSSKEIKYNVHKRPYYTLLYAEEIIKEIPDAKILIIQRDPISRYTSAKTRRLSNPSKSFHINRVNVVQAHTEVDASVDELIKKCLKTISPQNFKVILYEEMMTNTETVFQDVFSWLELPVENSFKKPTRLGKPAEAGSILITNKGLDKSSLNRNKQYFEITNESERTVHSYLLNKSGLISEKTGLIKFTLAYIKPFKNETKLQYLYKLLTFPLSVLISKEKIRNRLASIIKNRTGSISGAL